jgi:hypothetical protein
MCECASVQKFEIPLCELLNSIIPKTPPRPASSSADKSLRCEQCGGMEFGTSEELADHNRKELGK